MKHKSKTLLYGALMLPGMWILMSNEAFAASTATLTINDFQVSVGSTGLVPVNVNVTGGDIDAFEINITYDEGVVDVIDNANIILNPAFTGTVTADAGAGTSTIVANATTPLTGITKLADIRFTPTGTSGASAQVTVNPVSGGFLDSVGAQFDPEPLPDSATATLVDVTPDAFSFPNQINAPLSTFVESAPITVNGIDTPAVISTTTGEYSINGLPFTNLAGTVVAGDIVIFRIMSSPDYSTQTTGFLKIGTGGDDFKVTTIADPSIDVTPDAFSFVNQFDVPISTAIDSAPITVLGINSPATISITGGEYEINGSGTFTSEPGTVNVNDTVIVRLMSSASYATPTSAVLFIGTGRDDFRVTTIADPGLDITPDQFTFVDQIDVPVSSLTISEPIIVTGIDSPASISIVGGEYEVNGSGNFVSTPGTVNLNDSIIVRLTSSATFSTPADATLTIEGVSDTFSATTIADPADTTPDQFTFEDRVDVAPSTQVISNSVLVSGIGSPAPISITGGEYEINGSGTFTVDPGTVSAGDTVVVRLLSSAEFSTSTNAVLTIGETSDTFSVTTIAAPDTTPDQFTFVDQTDVVPSAEIVSGPIVVNGINSPAPISITGGEYSIDGGAYTNVDGTVTNGQSVTVRFTSSADFSTPTDATLTIGGVSDTFTATTFAADTTPDAFTLSAINDAPLSTEETSNTITVTGINSPAPISVTNGEYSINGGAFTNTDGTVNLNDEVVVRLTSSASFSTPTTATLTIGGISSDFTVTTIAEVVNDAPVLQTIPDQSVKVNSLLMFTAQATDPNGDTLTFSIADAPTGATFNTATGEFAWTPTQAGTFTFQITVSDGTLTDSQTVTVSVTAETPVVVEPTAPIFAAKTEDKDRCGKTCQQYKEVKREYKSDENRRTYGLLKTMKRNDLANFQRLESIYNTYKDLSDRELRKALNPQLLGDFKLFEKYKGYKHYLSLKDKVDSH